MSTKVFLIGGAPGAGKTTLGSALATRLGITSLSVDDLMTAAYAVTTAETHPDLHVMRQVPYLEYFTNSSVEKLKADATVQHEAMWPVIEQVVQKHVRNGTAIVIDGWHLRPSRVAQLPAPTVSAYWLVTSAAVLQERESNNLEWMQGSSNPDRMLENFLARSLWYNELIKEEATRLQLNMLFQSGEKSADDLCDMIVARSDH